MDDVDGSAVLRLFDNLSSTILDERLIDQDIDVSVFGNDQSDRLAIGYDRAALAHQIRVMFEGGAGGEDEIIGPDRANTWQLQASGTGDVDDVSFSGVERVKGGAAEDTFVVLDVSVSTSVDGGAGSDTLVGADADNDWTVTDDDAGTLNAQSFADIENLAGGAGDDSFAFTTDGQLSGAISGGDGNDTLIAANGDNTWVISGDNAGTLNAQATFSGIENLTL